MADKKIYRTIGGVIGNMELKNLSTGKLMLVFGVGVNSDPGSEHMAWMNCKAWEETAEQISQIGNKGDKILVNGPCEQYNGKWTLTVYDYSIIKRRP